MVRRRLWSRLKGLPTKTPVESIDLYAFVVAWSDFVGAIFNPVCTGVGLPNSDQTWLGAWERTTCRRKIRARRIWSSTLHTWRPWRVNCMTWAHHIPCDAPSDISCFRDFRACASWWRILKVPSCQARKGTTVLQLAEDSLRRPQGPGGRGWRLGTSEIAPGTQLRFVAFEFTNWEAVLLPFKHGRTAFSLHLHCFSACLPYVATAASLARSWMR